MKLLFDENLSPRLVTLLSDIFPNSSHVSSLSLSQTDDRTVWSYAKENDYILISKDSDHYELSMFYGFPPKIIWIRLGNCSTKLIESQIRKCRAALLDFEANSEQAVFLLL